MIRHEGWSLKWYGYTQGTIGFLIFEKKANVYGEINICMRLQRDMGDYLLEFKGCPMHVRKNYKMITSLGKAIIGNSSKNMQS